MGTQIGAVFALAGHPVSVQDISTDALERSRAQVQRRVGRMAEKGAIEAADAEAAVGRMTWTKELEDAAATADLVVEAASERLDIKREVFTRLGTAAPEHAILATNSSSIPSSLLAEASGRPDRLCNMHFFNPALVMQAVEIVPNEQTSGATIETVLRLTAGIGKHAVRLHAEVPGFVANRLMMALLNEAVALQAQGLASIEDIDAAAKLGLAHPMGPFELMDLVGLDVVHDIQVAMHDMTGGEDPAPHPDVQRLYDAGHFGQKSGKGWYDHS